MKNTLSLHPALIVLGLGLLVAADAALGADGDCRFSQQRSASLDTAGCDESRGHWPRGRSGPPANQRHGRKRSGARLRFK